MLADDHITELINLPLTRGPRAGPERALEPCATVTTKLNYGTKLEATQHDECAQPSGRLSTEKEER